jgi:hypothetical protein
MPLWVFQASDGLTPEVRRTVWELVGVAVAELLRLGEIFLGKRTAWKLSPPFFPSLFGQPFPPFFVGPSGIDDLVVEGRPDSEPLSASSISWNLPLVCFMVRG